MRTPADDPAPGLWLDERLMDWGSAEGGGQPVGAVVPTGFEAYVRFTPPVYSADFDRRYRWSEVAKATGRVAHPLMEWHRISTPAPGSGRAPWSWAAGEVDNPMAPSEADLLRLVALLRQFTETPESCWFCVWTGYGGIEERESGARIYHPGRDYFLSSGPIAAVTSFEEDQGPNIWWPADRAWCVATEIDLAGTYIGASGDCIDALLASDDLETYPVSVNDRVDVNADVINEK